MSNTIGEKELRTKWPVRDTNSPHLEFNESVVRRRDRCGIRGL